MTQMSREEEYNVLGCKVKVRPDSTEGLDALAVVNLVNAEVMQLRSTRPSLRDTDVAVLVALKMATEKMQLENEYKANICRLETTLEKAIQMTEAN